VRRRNRKAERGGKQNRDRSRRLRAKSAARFEARNAAAHGAHDAPPAAERTQADCGMRGENHPDRHAKGVEVFEANKTPVIIPWSLRVVRAMGELNSAAETSCSLRK